MKTLLASLLLLVTTTASAEKPFMTCKWQFPDGYIQVTYSASNLFGNYTAHLNGGGVVQLYAIGMDNKNWVTVTADKKPSLSSDYEKLWYFQRTCHN